MSRRVVITGMGALTPIGNTVEEFWAGVKKGTVGIEPMTRFDNTDFKVKVAAQLKNFNVLDHINVREAKRLDMESQYAIVAAREAIKDSGLQVTEENADRIGCIIGTGVGGIQTQENETRKLADKGPKRISPLLVPMFICNMAAGNVAIDLGLKGKCICVITACATGTNSIGEAYRSIQYGEVDAMVTGGTEASICPIAVSGFVALNALSLSEDPMKASRPFDKERNGFVMGEGAGVLVLEELEHAKARNAHIYAEIVGYGSTCDANHITSPLEDGSGAGKAMLQAIKEAGITPEKIDYVNAHGTSTELNDLYETRAIKYALREHAYKTVVNSTKSMVGHLLGAAGAVELITCVKSINEQYVHATVGLHNSDPECDLDYVPNEGRNIKVDYAISNSLGFGGHNASLIVKKYEE
ncbi:beta-ketoacyl-ACP synthase II [Anaeromicropila populeti]|uniref:3-oxoacyl-[acyl-carrier-protein] synthase 2 n=1 Tax=Anaeromicropila populeti TaxID=37658 RepID=A0A1I6LAJ5_9FIRM|nr:beta-ketoacyl-ACP synthase II [Anaeromicropila populeti]SFS00477.1 3-oxoacyl-[acyl-carrier-protein] synthase II [Anaeromicropila populeti]